MGPGLATISLSRSQLFSINQRFRLNNETNLLTQPLDCSHIGFKYWVFTNIFQLFVNNSLINITSKTNFLLICMKLTVFFASKMRNDVVGFGSLKHSVTTTTIVIGANSVCVSVAFLILAGVNFAIYWLLVTRTTWKYNRMSRNAK